MEVVLLAGLWCCPWISWDQGRMFCAQWYLCGDSWERETRHHNPSPALQVMRPFFGCAKPASQSEDTQGYGQRSMAHSCHFFVFKET